MQLCDGGLRVLQCSNSVRTLQPVAQACFAAVQHALEIVEIGIDFRLAVQASPIAVQLECLTEVSGCCSAVSVIEPCNL